MEKLLALTLGLSLLPLAAGGQNMARPDYEFARDAVARGDILPLSEVLARLQASHPGQVTEVELARDTGRLVYQVGLVTPGGRLIEVAMDAATGRVIGLNGSLLPGARDLGRDADDGDNGMDDRDDDDGDDDDGDESDGGHGGDGDGDGGGDDD